LIYPESLQGFSVFNLSERNPEMQRRELPQFLRKVQLALTQIDPDEFYPWEHSLMMILQKVLEELEVVIENSQNPEG